MADAQPNAHGLRYMAYSALWFAAMSVLVKIVGRDVPSHEIVLARAVITLVLSYAWLKSRGLSPIGNDKKLLVLRGLTGSIGLYCYYTSVTTIPLADATVLQYTNPVIAAVLSAIVLREWLGPREIACVVIGLVGTVLVARPSFLFGASELPPGPVALALFGAFASAVTYVVVRKVSRTDHPEVIVFYFPLVALPLSLPTLAFGFVVPSAFDCLLLLGIGVTTQIAQVYMTRGLALEATGRATAVTYLQVPLAYVVGLSLFGERPSWIAALGGVLVVGGTIALTLRRGVPPPTSEPSQPG